MEINRVTNELHKAFHLFNDKYFDGKLPTPAITIQSTRHERKTMGWCTTVPVWGDKVGNIKMYEINLSAEFLDLSFLETMDTLLHEMVHLYHKINNIQDCSRKGRYHNKKFKDKATQIGFVYETDKPDPKLGWSFAKLGPTIIDEIEKMGIDPNAFTISRKGFAYYKAIEEGLSPSEAEQQTESIPEKDSQTKSKSYKYLCPSCSLIMRSYKNSAKVRCMDCEEELLLQ